MQDWQDLESFWRATGIATALDESVTQEGVRRGVISVYLLCVEIIPVLTWNHSRPQHRVYKEVQSVCKPVCNWSGPLSTSDAPPPPTRQASLTPRRRGRWHSCSSPG